MFKQSFKLEDLVNKTVFLQLEFGVFGNLRASNVDINSTAKKERFRHQKKLLNSLELDAVNRADREFRAHIDLIALPYKLGMRIIPLPLVDQLYKDMKEFQTVTRPALVDKFLAAYTAQIAEAQVELKDEFNPENYPSLETLSDRFYFNYEVVYFSVPAHIKDVAPELYKKASEDAHAKLMSAADGISTALTLAAQELVAKITHGLSTGDDGKKRKLQSVQLEKLKEFLNTFDLRNVTDNEQLETEMNKLKAITDGVDVEKIKNSDTFRDELHKQFSSIADSLTTMITVKGRKFRKDAASVSVPEPELAIA